MKISKHILCLVLPVTALIASSSASVRSSVMEIFWSTVEVVIAVSGVLFAVLYSLLLSVFSSAAAVLPFAACAAIGGCMYVARKTQGETAGRAFGCGLAAFATLLVALSATEARVWFSLLLCITFGVYAFFSVMIARDPAYDNDPTQSRAQDHKEVGQWFSAITLALCLLSSLAAGADHLRSDQADAPRYRYDMTQAEVDAVDAERLRIAASDPKRAETSEFSDWLVNRAPHTKNISYTRDTIMITEGPFSVRCYLNAEERARRHYGLRPLAVRACALQRLRIQAGG